MTNPNLNDFWNDENKQLLQKELDQSFYFKKFHAPKIMKECLAIQGLSIIGALGLSMLSPDTINLNKQMLFTLACTSASLAYLRSKVQKRKLDELVSGLGICSFFGSKINIEPNVEKKVELLKISETMLNPSFNTPYKLTKKALLLSCSALVLGLICSKIQPEMAMAAGISIWGVCNLYDFIHANVGIKKISNALPKGVHLPCLKKQNERV